jgi:hypothetical protein
MQVAVQMFVAVSPLDVLYDRQLRHFHYRINYDTSIAAEEHNLVPVLQRRALKLRAMNNNRFIHPHITH